MIRFMADSSAVLVTRRGWRGLESAVQPGQSCGSPSAYLRADGMTQPDERQRGEREPNEALKGNEHHEQHDGCDPLHW